ncbi:MAG: hypothetical protein RLZ09_2415 [Pseudomonadota bacterium]|jgi:uncharacterized membrane protein
MLLPYTPPALFGPIASIYLFERPAMPTRKWIAKKNCSISPKQLLKAYLALCSASFLVALYFMVYGAWVVMLFAVLEMMAVGFAFVYCGRHAGDTESVVLGDEGLVVELVEAERVHQVRMDPRRTRIEIPALRHRLIALEANGDRIEVGRFLTERKRREFAQELRRELMDYRLAPAAV